MNGLEAITANNGWAMALAGALIVMSGLSLLSFIISQLYKVIALFEKSHLIQGQNISKIKPPPNVADTDIFKDPAAAAHYFQPLTLELGDTFELQHIHMILKQEGLPNPHLTIRLLREAGLLVPKGAGLFTWNLL